MKTIRKVLLAVLQYLRNLRECDPPDLAAGDAQMLASSIDFEFLLFIEIATPVFMETSITSRALQLDELDLAATYSFRWCLEASSGAKERQPGRRRTVPAKLKYSSTSATEDDQVQIMEEHYRGRIYYTFLDRLRQELERRFYGEEHTWDTVMSLHSLTEPEQWKDVGKGFAVRIHYACFMVFRGKRPTFRAETVRNNSSPSCR